MKSILILLTSLLLSSVVFAQTPSIIRYEGRVTVNGTAFDGTGFFKFALVDGDTVLWDNDPNDGVTQLPSNASVAPVEATVLQGRFSVPLGDTTVSNMDALDPDDFLENDRVTLRVWFSDDNVSFSKLTPAQRLIAVPYALVAKEAENAKSAERAETVVANAIGSEQIADGAVSREKLMTVEQIPTGTVIPYAGVTVPEGWLICDGESYPSDDPRYAALADVLEGKYGADENSFAVPDLRGRTVIGTGRGDTWIEPDGDDESTDWQLGDKYGSEKHQLTTDEMPRHNHGGFTSTDGAHWHRLERNSGSDLFWADGGGSSATNIDAADNDGWRERLKTNETGNHNHSISPEGKDDPHNNMQPSLVLNYIIKL